MRMINLAGFLARSQVNGPGTRAVIWVQGCPLRCEGCFNPQFQPFSPATQVPVDRLFETILSITGINGVTFSGGEPFAQAAPLAELGTKLRDAGLDVVTYSGYTADQLLAGSDPAWRDLLSATDLLIAGPYIPGLACTGSLYGSANQQVIPLTERGQEYTSPQERGSRVAEFTISVDGTITTSGFPESRLIKKLASRCGGA